MQEHRCHAHTRRWVIHRVASGEGMIRAIEPCHRQKVEQGIVEPVVEEYAVLVIQGSQKA